MENDVNRPVSRRLHPAVNAAIVGLALLYILAVWIGFAGNGLTDYLLFIASMFVLGALALPLIVFCMWRANRGPDAGREGQETFRRWALGDFDTVPGRVRGLTAAVEILLPIAAVSFGMMAFAIVALING